ncbi:MAG: family transporter [Oscillospiraceae bacterium]|nr:family transporter [Oscillospiraceae bacterium]
MDKKLIKTLLLFIFFATIIVFAIFNIQTIMRWVINLIVIVRPVIIGIAIAIILNNPLCTIERMFRKLFKKDKFKKLARILAIVCIYLLLILIIVALLWIIIPQLVQSTKQFVGNIEKYYANFDDVIRKVFSWFKIDLENDLDLQSKLQSGIRNIPSVYDNFLEKGLNIAKATLGTLAEIFIGIVISIYILVDKTKIKAQIIKILAAMFSKRTSKKIKFVLNLIINTFSNFINGQMLESAILGILCFVGMLIFGFKYAILISVIMAITNLIPMIGPIIGVVPSTIILLLVSPSQALWFLVFIIILQQLEANLIYPRVVGSSVGLPPLWILIAVIVGGNAFGFLGMVIGIPTMSIIYVLIKNAVNDKILAKNITEL